jgi:hypothetical protein
MAGKQIGAAKVRQRDRERQARAQIRGRNHSVEPGDPYPEPFVAPLTRGLRAVVILAVVAACAGFWGGLIACIARAIG